MTETSPATVAYRSARDQLIELREDQPRAVAEFRWPDVGTWRHAKNRGRWCHE